MVFTRTRLCLTFSDAVAHHSGLLMVKCWVVDIPGSPHACVPFWLSFGYAVITRPARVPVYLIHSDAPLMPGASAVVTYLLELHFTINTLKIFTFKYQFIPKAHPCFSGKSHQDSVDVELNLRTAAAVIMIIMTGLCQSIPVLLFTTYS